MVTYGAYQFGIHFNVDLTLLSIAVIFPLVFSIRGSFRRREKAIEHLSQFRASITSMIYLVNSSTKITPEYKREISQIFYSIGDKMIHHLKGDGNDTTDIDNITNLVYVFIMENLKNIPGGIRDRVFRIMENMNEAIDNLHGIHVHRTPISLKAYCLVFIYLFPLIYAPTLIHTIGIDTPAWAPYVVVLLTEFILISLYNIQDQLEYPFDSKGLDDIKLELFIINRNGEFAYDNIIPTEPEESIDTTLAITEELIDPAPVDSQTLIPPLPPVE